MRRELVAARIFAPPVSNVHHVIAFVCGAEPRSFALVPEDGITATLMPFTAAVLDILHVREMVVGTVLRALAHIAITGSFRTASVFTMPVNNINHVVEAMHWAECCFLTLVPVDWLKP